MKKLTRKALYSLAVTILATYSNASAATVTADPGDLLGPSASNSIPDGTGFYLFAVNNVKVDENSLPAYASFGTESAIYQEHYSAILAAGGSTYSTGVAYGNAGVATAAPVTGLAIPGTGTAVQFATFELSAATPLSFEVGVLSNYPDLTYYTIDLYSGNPNAGGTLLSSSGVIDPNQTSNDNGSTADPRSNNEFYYADVTGAGAGDYLAILGNTSNTDKGDQVTLGGVTFDTVATTPEPSTYALMLGGLGMLALVARLRRKA